jgi:hypothetical protein
MKVEEKLNYILISDDIDKNANFEKIEASINQAENQNIVLQASINNLNNGNIDRFISISEGKKANGTSFVIVSKEISVDTIPESLNVVPTITEAEDIIEMENIERELGF